MIKKSKTQKVIGGISLVLFFFAIGFYHNYWLNFGDTAISLSILGLIFYLREE